MAGGWSPLTAHRWAFRIPGKNVRKVSFPHRVTEREARRGARAMLNGSIAGSLPRGTKLERLSGYRSSRRI